MDVWIRDLIVIDYFAWRGSTADHSIKDMGVDEAEYFYHACRQVDDADQREHCSATYRYKAVRESKVSSIIF